MKKTTVSLAHGNGGRLMNELILDVFLTEFNSDASAMQMDAAEMLCEPRMMMTTDGYTVDPLFFPGGDIGKLAVCGTLNDLLVSGAVPQYLSVNYLIEEGFDLNDLKRIAKSMGDTARENNVSIIAGDTKVLPKGSLAGLYITTTGVGRVMNDALSMNIIEPGDRVFISGSVGDHGASVMLAREAYGLQGEIKSDCQSLKPLVDTLIGCDGLKFMRDPTRGGLATVCHEISQATGLGFQLKEKEGLIKAEVRTFCDLLGFDPLYLACEGRVLFITSDAFNVSALGELTASVLEIGVTTDEHDRVVMETPLGGLKILAQLEHEALPRIC